MGDNCSTCNSIKFSASDSIKFPPIFATLMYAKELIAAITLQRGGGLVVWVWKWL